MNSFWGRFALVLIGVIVMALATKLWLIVIGGVLCLVGIFWPQRKK